jgi:Zn-dependent protease
MITDYSIQAIAINAIPLIFAITIHEAAHGYAARRFGDNTAYLLGRVTLNPAKHIDLVGTILIPLALILTGSPFLVGYAKPVPVNFGRLRNPRIDSIWVALAGPGSNFFQAIIWAILLILLLGFGINEKFFIEMAQAGMRWNLVLLVFNLFPLPPLDGGRILVGLLPWKQAVWLSRVEPYGFYIVMALVVLKVVDTLWMAPLMTLTFELLSLMLSPFAFLLKPSI